METIAAIPTCSQCFSLWKLATSVGVGIPGPARRPGSHEPGSLSLCTPPVGVCLFAATNIAGNKLSDNVKALGCLLLLPQLHRVGFRTYVHSLTTGVASLS